MAAFADGVVAGLYRYPLKGFSAEPLSEVLASVNKALAGDRIYAVENGPSGFLRKSPTHISKTKLVALVGVSRLAHVFTQLDLRTHELLATTPGMEPFTASLRSRPGREQFSAWLTRFLGDDVKRELRVLEAPAHHFLDSPAAHISVINLASLRDLERRMDRTVDPVRFRANIHIDGWPPWSELGIENGATFNLGAARLKVFYWTSRCVATHVNPRSGLRDLDIMTTLRTLTPNVNFGFYVLVIDGSHHVRRCRKRLSACLTTGIVR